VAVEGGQPDAAGSAGLRNLAYLWAAYRLFASDGRLTSVRRGAPGDDRRWRWSIFWCPRCFIADRINPAC
jgi:hypothetical protein